MPVLNLLLGIEVKRAVAAALFAYLPSGVVAVVLYARRGSIAWREARFLALGALPASWLGARAAGIAPGTVLELAIGALLLGGGVYALRPPKPVAAERARLGAWLLIALGAVTGFGSALTGAGGAFILMPLLFLLDTPVLGAIGLSQSIVVPVAGVASISNAFAGLVDFGLSAGLTVALMAGIAIGTPVAHALPQDRLRRAVGWIVVVAGLAMLVKVAVRVFV